MQTFAYILIIAPVCFFIFWKFYFLRDPKRTTPKDEDAVIAPADGRVIEIFEFKGDAVDLYKGNRRYLGKIHSLTKNVSNEGYVISIFMSPMDVHQNRAPITGSVMSVKHRNGRFLAVNSFDSGLMNEKSEIIIHGKIKVKMIQIAGFLARRIETNVKANDFVHAGEHVGLINLGSQVTMILPKSVKLKVAKGDRTVAGETILAKIDS